MADVVDVLYRLRNMAGEEAEQLQKTITEAADAVQRAVVAAQITIDQAVSRAQGILEKLDRFADDAEDVAELAAASNLFPTHHASIPARAGLVEDPDRPTPEVET